MSMRCMAGMGDHGEALLYLRCGGWVELGSSKPEGWLFLHPRALHAEDPSRRPPSDSGQGKYSEEGPH